MQRNEPTMGAMAIAAAVVALAVTLGCAIWQSSAKESSQEAAQRATENLQSVINDMASGKRHTDIPPPPPPPWPAQHPILSGVIAFFAVLILGRLYIFMLRVEHRD